MGASNKILTKFSEQEKCCIKTCFSCQRAEHPWALFRRKTVPSRPQSTVLPETCEAPIAPQGGPVQPRNPPCLQEPKPFLCARSPPLQPKGGAFPLTPSAARVCGAELVSPSSSSSTAPFPLPSEFQVNGSPKEEAAIPHLLASVRLPLSPSSGGRGRTPGRAGQSTQEPVRGATGETCGHGATYLPQPGLALVRMLGGRAAWVGGKEEEES